MKKFLILLSTILTGFYLSYAINLDLFSGDKISNTNWSNIANITDKVYLSGNNLNINGKLVSTGKICAGNVCLGECDSGYYWDANTKNCVNEWECLYEYNNWTSAVIALTNMPGSGSPPKNLLFYWNKQELASVPYDAEGMSKQIENGGYIYKAGDVMNYSCFSNTGCSGIYVRTYDICRRLK